MQYTLEEAQRSVGRPADVMVPAPRSATVPVSSLAAGDSPRSAGLDEAHILRLVESEEPLPPILVDRRGMRVIDGVHRLMAAILRGEETVVVEFFDGSAEDAFLRGVQANVAHGLPLSLADRRAAAARIVVSHPHLADRAIAKATGLGARTVAVVRRCSTDGVPQLGARVGADGRLRPLNATAGRLRAAALFGQRPHASLREVAKEAGVSLATASDVRKRLERGEDPLRARDGAAERERTVRALEPRPADAGGTVVTTSSAAVLEKLLRDPSLRHNDEGRRLLQVLRHNAFGDSEWSQLAAAVPGHCAALVADLAQSNAQRWKQFAQAVVSRAAQPEL